MIEKTRDMAREDWENIDSIINRLRSPGMSVSTRMRAIFALKGWGGAKAVTALAECMRSDASVLVKHEAAYCLGQMQDKDALPFLEMTLRDEQEDVIVRHEAAEAMGAIGDPLSLPILDQYSSNANPQEVFETCTLAAARIRTMKAGGTRASPDRDASMALLATDRVAYTSVDPAPPMDERMHESIEELCDVLCNQSGESTMFARYRAMFSLRNIGGPRAVQALCDAMLADTNSALFRHEVAFVLGQMQHLGSVQTLAAFLRNTAEHEMVRHESAEALGSIATPEAQAVLNEFLHDPNDIVRESVHVALDISDYNCDNSELHYTDIIRHSKSVVTKGAGERTV